ncbi:36059_t:CDS:2, partial [Racocetra persica]
MNLLVSSFVGVVGVSILLVQSLIVILRRSSAFPWSFTFHLSSAFLRRSLVILWHFFGGFLCLSSAFLRWAFTGVLLSFLQWEYHLLVLRRFLELSVCIAIGENNILFVLLTVAKSVILDLIESVLIIVSGCIAIDSVCIAIGENDILF